MSIQPGIYRIKNAKSGTYFDASLKDQGVIHGWAGRPENKNQQWILEQGGQGFVIKNAETGAFAGVCGDSNGDKLEARGEPTEWNIEDKGNGTFAIIVAGTQQACDLDMGHSKNGTSISIWHFTGAQQQHWHFEQEGGGNHGGGGYGGQQQSYQQPQQEQQQQQQQQQYSGAIPAGTYCIENVHSGTACDLAGGGAGDGTPIIGWSANRGANQSWQLIPGQNGYKFKNVGSGTYLSFQGGGEEGTMICGHSSNVVEWQVTQADQGYSIHCANNPNIVLDLAGGGNADGVKICLYSNHQGPNQQWKFEQPQ